MMPQAFFVRSFLVELMFVCVFNGCLSDFVVCFADLVVCLRIWSFVEGSGSFVCGFSSVFADLAVVWRILHGKPRNLLARPI